MPCGSVGKQQAHGIMCRPDTPETLRLEHSQRRAGKCTVADLQMYDRVLEVFPAVIEATLSLDLAAMSEDDGTKLSGVWGCVALLLAPAAAARIRILVPDRRPRHRYRFRRQPSPRTSFSASIVDHGLPLPAGSSNRGIVHGRSRGAIRKAKICRPATPQRGAFPTGFRQRLGGKRR